MTQLIDPEDPVLGFVVDQVRALRASADPDSDVVVITNEARNVPRDLESSVISMGKEHGYGRVHRALRYLVTLSRLAASRRVDALVAHMCPIYLVAAAPITKVARIRTALWFVHPSDTRVLRFAERITDVVVTALPRSYPRQGPKIVPIGHAIDTEGINPTPFERNTGEPLRLLAVGRTSPVKGYATLIAAATDAHRAGAAISLQIVGPSVTQSERDHRTWLVGLADASHGVVEIADGVPREEIARTIADAHVLVNTTERGSADKVVFEAMAASRPVLVTSDAFAPLMEGLQLPLLCQPADRKTLGERMGVLAGTSTAVLETTGRDLRARVEREHSLQHWAGELRKVLDGLR